MLTERIENEKVIVLNSNLENMIITAVRHDTNRDFSTEYQSSAARYVDDIVSDLSDTTLWVIQNAINDMLETRAQEFCGSEWMHLQKHIEHEFRRRRKAHDETVKANAEAESRSAVITISESGKARIEVDEVCDDMQLHEQTQANKRYDASSVFEAFAILPSTEQEAAYDKGEKALKEI